MARLFPRPRYPLVIEPFAGGAGYSLYWEPDDVVLIERNPVIAEMWRWLLSATPEEILALPDIGPDDLVDDIDAPQGARTWIGMWCNVASDHPMHRLSAWARAVLGYERRAGTYSDQLVWSWRVRQRAARHVPRMRRWRVIEGDYHDAPDVEATWFIDPPYDCRAGEHYPHGRRGIDYAELADWCRSRRGQVIVCERQGADWLPFSPLASTQSTRGKSAEAIWTSDPDPQLSLFEEAT